MNAPPRLITLALHSPTLPQTSADEGAYQFETAVQALVRDAHSQNYDYVCLPFTNDSWKTRWRKMCLRLPGLIDDTTDQMVLQEQAEKWRAQGGLDRAEVTITRLDEVDHVIGLVSDWLELDSYDEFVRHDSEVALRQELAYASYLNMHTMILPPPRNRAHVADYARAVNACLTSSGTSQYLNLSIRIPIYVPPAATAASLHASGVPESNQTHSSQVQKDLHATENELIATWEMWDTIRTICGYNHRLSLTLDLAAPLPSASRLLSRWVAEPTRLIFLPATSFVANAKGYPVLPKATQVFLRKLVAFKPTIILSGTEKGLHKAGGNKAYVQYVQHLEKTSDIFKALTTSDSIESFCRDYNDYLQAPLQPLMDNLQSTTYEVFERDPVKYAKYAEAVTLALLDRPEDSRTVICVAGAGRGPLVHLSLQAITQTGRNAHVYAVEKNPGAFVTLQDRNTLEWNGQVTLLFGDMRELDVPERANILVSELLGSFGDNELSPECLDGAMRFLHPDGVSIPCSYSAHIAPLSSSKLYNEVNGAKDRARSETPYVVMFQAVDILSGDGGGLFGRCGTRVQEAWDFTHPRKDLVLNAAGLPLTNTHNVRATRLTFHIPHAGVMHGLAGYFDARLYGDVGLSTHPDRKDLVSPNMLSWFPIFFPFKEPLFVPADSELDVSMWRMTEKTKVWYEWYAEVFLPGSPSQTDPSPSTPLSARSPATPPRRVSSFMFMGSPMLDAPTSIDGGLGVSSDPADPNSRIKIGQTTLHNAGGRSSWIGL
jgi:protein arginine N-methyltransferase 5